MPSTSNANPRNLSVGGASSARPPGGGSSAIPSDNQANSGIQVNQAGSSGLLRVVSNVQLQTQEQQLADTQAQNRADAAPKYQGLAAHVREAYYEFRSQRETRGISLRLLESLRAYRGEYTENKITAIKQFGGSDVYARITALKCRGATAMLRDIYLSGDRPWQVTATPVPTIPENITKSILAMVNSEVETMRQFGQNIPQEQVSERVSQLTKDAEQATVKNAAEEAERATRFLDDMLVEGGFYDVLVDFLHNLTVFPYAFMKGPVVRMSTDVVWRNGQAITEDNPKLFWTAPSPFDVYWLSGASNFGVSDVIEHIRLTRAELNSLIGVPGYNEAAVRGALDTYGRGGLSDWLDYTDSQRARLELREDPHHNRSNLIDTLEFHGHVQGETLLDYGFTAEEVPDPTVDYYCTVWLIDQFVIKAQIDPFPRKRHPYYMTSFEKIPGAIVGHGLPEILSDIQDVANASLRALVNNLSIASGPQVIINDDRMSPNNDNNELYPWKRWHTLSDPFGSTEKAVDFFQPSSNSQELMAVYNQMTVIADEISSIPRYMTGSGNVGGAGRTASGLSMLMQNASKVLQGVAANIDNDIFSPLLKRLHDTVLLTDRKNTLRGDEQIRVRGVVFANQRETERTRLLEFLALTANPIDSQIVGMEGRAELLREVADRIGLDQLKVVPDEPTTPPPVEGQPGSGATPNGMPPPEAGNVDEGIRSQTRGPSGQAV